MTEAQVLTMITALTPVYPFLFALAAVMFKWLIATLPKDRQAEVNQVVQMVVQGVEQCANGKSGPEKKQMAVTRISTVLNSLHISVPPMLVDAMIEATVYGINQSQPISLPSVPVNQALQAASGINAMPTNG
ncbi:MAG TPA: phage holin, LLH family [Ktedonobacteraceae bacterium]|nr:phage holin, LLH family [Ktedonobacteraceae bacterium]